MALRDARANRPIIDLTLSNPTEVGLPHDRAAILEAMADPRQMIYEPDPFGLESARRAVAGLWQERGVSVDIDRIVLCASTSEAYAFVMKLLCDPGDSVLVPRPSYPLFEHLAQSEGVELSHYRLDYDGSWHVDLDSVRRAMTAETRAVFVVSPNNPTGSYVTAAELAALSSLGLPLVSDEVFWTYPLSDGLRRVSALSAPAPLSIVLDGLSKIAALPQAKVGWITLAGQPDRVRDATERLEIIADTFLSVGTAVQHALPALLAHRGPVHDAITARVQKNLAVLRRAAADSAMTLLECEGGWSAVLRLPSVRDEDEWVLGLLEEADVAVQPGWFYDFERGPFVVLSLLTPEDVLEEGAARLVRHVSRVAAGR